MSTIYLVRHGQASFGADNYDQLSDTGREQVRQLGNYFAGLGERIDRIYSGGLRRQTETAEIIAESFAAGAPPIALEPAFNEYDSDLILHTFAKSLRPEQLAEAGWPELRTDRRKFQFFLERAARAWAEARIEAEEMTSWRGFHGRIVSAMESIMRTEGRSKTLIVSTSGGVIVAQAMGPVESHRHRAQLGSSQRLHHAPDLQRGQSVAVSIQRPAAPGSCRAETSHYVPIGRALFWTREIATQRAFYISRWLRHEPLSV